MEENDIQNFSPQVEKVHFSQHSKAALIALGYVFVGFVFLFSGFQLGSGDGSGLYFGPIILLVVLVSILQPILSLIPKFLYSIVTTIFSSLDAIIVAGFIAKYVSLLILISIPFVIAWFIIRHLKINPQTLKLTKSYMMIAFVGLIVWSGIFFLNDNQFGIAYTSNAHAVIQTICESDTNCENTVLANNRNFVRNKNGATFPFISLENYTSASINMSLSEKQKALYCEHAYGPEQSARKIFKEPGIGIKYSEIACRSHLGFVESFSVAECIESTEKRFYSASESDASYFIKPCATDHLGITPLTRELFKKITDNQTYDGLMFSPQTTTLLTTAAAELSGISFLDGRTGSVVRSVTQYPSNAQTTYLKGDLLTRFGNYDDINNKPLQLLNKKPTSFFGVGGSLEELSVDWSPFSNLSYQPKYSNLFQASVSVGDSFFLVSGFDTRGDLHDGNAEAEKAVIQLAEAIVRYYLQTQFTEDLQQ